MSAMPPSRAVVDTAAITANVAFLAARTQARVMGIIKADAYGHGAPATARAAVAGGASWLGIAQVAEAVALHPQLPDVPIFSWIYAPETDLTPAVALGIELSVGAPWAVRQVGDAARRTGRRARVHLALDSGMSREGIRPEHWADLVAAVRAEPDLDPIGIWSHLSHSDVPTHPATARQVELLQAALATARQHGIQPEVVHLANTGGVLWHPATHFDLVRIGIGMYGLAPDGSDPAALGLTPAMQLEAELVNLHQAPAGTPVSYGGTATVGPTVLGVVPLGYADGVPRQASGNGAWVSVNGQRAPVVGVVCMDQFVVDLGPHSRARPGDTAILFGAGPGMPRADDWARAAGTINYDVTTRVGSRVPRAYL